MKRIFIAILGLSAIALGFVAWRAPRREYVAPTLEEVEAHTPAPDKLVGEIPAGFVVRTIDVEGMCCHGCTGKLYAKLKAAPGVEQAAVDFDRKVAEVVVPANADASELARLLTFDKYSAKLEP